MRLWDSNTHWDDPRIQWDQPAPPLGRVIELRTNIALYAAPDNERHLVHKLYVDEALAIIVGAVAGDIAALRASLQAEITALKTYPLTFAFGGTPVVGSVIQVPLVHNLSIPPNLAGSRYYNATNPLVASTFTLTVQPAGTTIGTVSINTSGAAMFSGTGSNSLVVGNVLRLTATTVGGSLTNAAITIEVTRR